MMLGVSSTTGLLVGLSLVSVGVLVVSSWSLLRDVQRNEASRWEARMVASQVSAAIAGEIDEWTFEGLAGSVRDALGELRRGGDREYFQVRVNQATMLLERIQPQIDVIKPAHDAAMSLSVDKLAHLDEGEESKVAALLAFIDSVERLREEIAATRMQWGFS